MDDKLILLEAHRLGIKLDRPRKALKGYKGKVHAIVYEGHKDRIESISYKPNCSLKNTVMKRQPDELKRYDGPEDAGVNESSDSQGPTAPETAAEPVTEAAEA